MAEAGEAKLWDRYLDETDRAVIARGRFAQRMGFGDRPAVDAASSLPALSCRGDLRSLRVELIP